MPTAQPGSSGHRRTYHAATAINSPQSTNNMRDHRHQDHATSRIHNGIRRSAVPCSQAPLHRLCSPDDMGQPFSALDPVSNDSSPNFRSYRYTIASKHRVAPTRCKTRFRLRDYALPGGNRTHRSVFSSHRFLLSRAYLAQSPFHALLITKLRILPPHEAAQLSWLRSFVSLHVR